MKRLIKKICFLQRDDSGAVIILVALMLIVLMGMAALAVDGGTLYQNRRNMVNAADAAALAGAQELIFANSDADVVKFAEDFAINNYGCDPDLVEAKIINPYTVGVKTGRNVNLNFAGVLGTSQSDVTAYAEAEFTPLVSAANIVPWAVPVGWLPDDWDKAECVVCEEHPDDCNCCQWCGEEDRDECGCDGVVVLKVGPPGGGGQSGQIGSGNFHSLALTGPGANVYCEDIKSGYEGTIDIGDCLETQTGDIVGKTKEGVEYRIDNCCNDYNEITYMCNNLGCPRYVTTPVFDEEETDLTGQGCVKVIGFATFYLIAYIHDGATHEVHAYFVPEHIASGIGSEGFNYDIDFGTYNLRLIE